MQTVLFRLVPGARSVTGWLEARLAPVADLLIRVALFQVFFFPGLAKLADWSGTLRLFHDVYQVPLLPPGLAAVTAASDELVCSVLLLVGLGARFAALPLLAQSLVIQFALGSAYQSLEHTLWMALLVAVIARGPGTFSLDHVIRGRLMGRDPV
jgi:putative oxidoreductase